MRRCSLLVLIALLCAFTSAPVMAHDHDPPRIMPAGVMEKMSSGAEVVFLDTRTESARASGPAGISGSVHIHNNEALRKFIENTPKDSFIVTYCT